MILLKACFNSLPSVISIKQLNCELYEVFQFLDCTTNMNEVPGMNIINKFADSLGMLLVNLNIFTMRLFVFAPENQLLIAEFGLSVFIA